MGIAVGNEDVEVAVIVEIEEVTAPADVLGGELARPEASIWSVNALLVDPM